MGYWACEFDVAHLISSYPRINKLDPDRSISCHCYFVREGLPMLPKRHAFYRSLVLPGQRNRGDFILFPDTPIFLWGKSSPRSGGCRTLRVWMGDIYIFAQHVTVYPENGSCMSSAAPGSWLNPLTALVKHGEVFDVFIRWSIPSAPMSLWSIFDHLFRRGGDCNYGAPLPSG